MHFSQTKSKEEKSLMCPEFRILNPESTSIKSSIKKSSLLQYSLHIEDRYVNNSRGTIGPKRLSHCCAKVAQSFS